MRNQSSIHEEIKCRLKGERERERERERKRERDTFVSEATTLDDFCPQLRFRYTGQTEDFL